MAARETNDWQQCPSGEISRMVGGIRARQRRRTAVRASVLGGLMLLVLGGGGFAVKKGMVDGLSCRQVLATAPEFVSRELDFVTTQRVRLHLVHCEFCRRKLDEIASSQSAHPAAAQSLASAAADGMPWTSGRNRPPEPARGVFLAAQ